MKENGRWKNIIFHKLCPVQIANNDGCEFDWVKKCFICGDDYCFICGWNKTKNDLTQVSEKHQQIKDNVLKALEIKGDHDEYNKLKSWKDLLTLKTKYHKSCYSKKLTIISNSLTNHVEN